MSEYNLISIIEDKPKLNKKKITEEYIKECNSNIYKKYFPFALEILPKSFKKVSTKELKFIRETIKQKSGRENRFFNNKLLMEIDCYLKDCNIDSSDILKFLMFVCEGLLFKKKEQIKNIKFSIKDIAKDPYNSGNPFIGIVLRKV